MSRHKGLVQASREIFVGVVCPTCGGPKGSGSTQCWRCAGMADPSTRVHVRGQLRQPGVPPPPDAELLRVSEVAYLLSMSRAKTYELVASGEIPSVRIGKSIRVPRRRLVRLIDERTTGGGS